MKKIMYALILLFLLIFSFEIFAKEGITNYYIDATILSNGDIRVKEIFTMNGTFNGMNRIINHKGSTIKFDGTINSFKGSDIYNGDSIIINEIKGIPYSKSIQYSDINKSGTIFNEVEYANKGDYGKYTKSNNYNGIDLLIYNPSNRNNAFYIDYTITNMAIVHNDIAELGFNIFTEMREYIENLEMYIHIPNNKDLLKVWAHGPLWGESKIIDKNTVKVEIKELEAFTSIDVRLAFDKSVLNESYKITNVDALDKIIEIETIQANIANQQREEAKKLIEKQERIELILNGLKVSWFVILLIVIYNVYIKHDKEYKKELETKYYRDFPSDLSPTTVGYLTRKKINNDDLSASILLLIYKKILNFQEVSNKKADYMLMYNQTENLSDSDKKLLEFLFNKSFNSIEDKNYCNLALLQKKATNSYDSFLRKYTIWKNAVESEAICKKFYEDKSSLKLITGFYSILGLLISIKSFDYSFKGISILLNCLVIISTIISFIYFVVFSKRTKEANLEYIKWIGLKNFMEDFGRMDKKELPEIVLWEKYLVYAVTLGCADKLAKEMEIKAKELQETELNNIGDIHFDYYRFNTITNFNRTINRTIDRAVSSAYSARAAANSTSSSGGGSGGGFSGGGGSFGGGGGGGRF